MKDLIVVDFDKTLIPFDSFRKYLIIWFKYYPIYFSVILVLRKLKIISSGFFKELIVKKVLPNSQFPKINSDFANSLLNYIDNNIMLLISKYKNSNSFVLLLSASPDNYIKIVGKKLYIHAKGSYFQGNKFYHLHGKGKINFINTEFPKSQFNYVFSISDSKSDLELLSKFQEYKLIR